MATRSTDQPLAREDGDRTNPVDWARGTPSERPPRGFLDRRRFVETKWSFKTSELLVLTLAVIGVLVAAWKSANLDAPRAWTLVAALAIGYMLSRGLAKLGKGTYDDA
jgi:hypothetical protein